MIVKRASWKIELHCVNSSRIRRTFLMSHELELIKLERGSAWHRYLALKLNLHRPPTAAFTRIAAAESFSCFAKTNKQKLLIAPEKFHWWASEVGENLFCFNHRPRYSHELGHDEAARNLDLLRVTRSPSDRVGLAWQIKSHNSKSFVWFILRCSNRNKKLCNEGKNRLQCWCFYRMCGSLFTELNPSAAAERAHVSRIALGASAEYIGSPPALIRSRNLARARRDHRF